MTPDTIKAVDRALKALGCVLANAMRDTDEVSLTNDIPKVAQHFYDLRNKAGEITRQAAALEAHVRDISYEIIPTLFTNQDIKSIHVVGLGRVTINVRWNAMMPDKEKGMQWLRDTGNEGLIISTVNAQTLSSFAKDMALNGMPLPNEVFKVGTAQHVSITKE